MLPSLTQSCVSSNASYLQRKEIRGIEYQVNDVTSGQDGMDINNFEM